VNSAVVHCTLQGFIARLVVRADKGRRAVWNYRVHDVYNATHERDSRKTVKASDPPKKLPPPYDSFLECFVLIVNENHARRASAGPTPQWGKRGGVGKLECFVRVLARRVSRDEAH
jgi:hypothetical protein